LFIVEKRPKEILITSCIVPRKSK